MRALKMQRTKKNIHGDYKMLKPSRRSCLLLFDNIRKYVARHNAEKVNLCLYVDVGIDKQGEKY